MTLRILDALRIMSRKRVSSVINMYSFEKSYRRE